MDVSERMSFCARKQNTKTCINELFFLLLITIKLLHTRLTFKFSGQNWWPYMSMADRKMDSTWLCLSSYDGKCDAIKTCNTFKNIILSRNNETLKDWSRSGQNVMLPVWLSTPPSSSPSCWAAWARSEWPSAHLLALDLFHTADPAQGTKCLWLNSSVGRNRSVYAWLCSGWRAPYYEHRDEDVLFGDLGVREDVLQHRTHVRFVPFSQVDNTLVIVSCMWEQEWNYVSYDKQ